MAAYYKQGPPVMVVSSSNNQAVTNAIDSFGQVFKASENLFERRWLPEIESYGLYMASPFRLNGEAGKELKKKYHVVDPRGSEFPSKINTQEYVERAKPYFLKLFNSYFEQAESDIGKAESYIHKKLVAEIAKIQEPIKEYIEIEKLISELTAIFLPLNNESLSEAKERWLKEKDKKIGQYNMEINCSKEVIEINQGRKQQFG